MLCLQGFLKLPPNLARTLIGPEANSALTISLFKGSVVYGIFLFLFIF